MYANLLKNLFSFSQEMGELSLKIRTQKESLLQIHRPKEYRFHDFKSLNLIHLTGQLILIPDYFLEGNTYQQQFSS